MPITRCPIRSGTVGEGVHLLRHAHLPEVANAVGLGVVSVGATAENHSKPILGHAGDRSIDRFHLTRQSKLLALPAGSAQDAIYGAYGNDLELLTRYRNAGDCRPPG